MRSVSLSFIAVAILSATAASASAQQAVQLDSGARVRLLSPKLPADQQVVRIVSTANDTVVFQTERHPGTRRLALSEIRAVDVSAGQRRNTLRGAMIGLAAGAGVGAIVSYATYQPCEGFCFLEPSSPEEAAGWGGAAGGVIGLLAGTTIGFFMKSEKWRRVQTNTVIGIAPAGRGGVVSVSHAFR
jgi:hypothetical protein